MSDGLVFAILFGLSEGALLTYFVKSDACKMFYWTTMLYAAFFIPFCSWYFAATNVVATVLLMLMTYVSLLLAAKRNVKRSTLPYLHLTLTVLLILFTCIAFGARYTWHYFPECDFLTYLVKVFKWKTYPGQMSQFAAVGFREFFTSVENRSITDDHVFQKLIGCILTLGIIPWTVNSFGKAPTLRS